MSNLGSWVRITTAVDRSTGILARPSSGHSARIESASGKRSLVANLARASITVTRYPISLASRWSGIAMWMAPTITMCAGRGNGSSNRFPSLEASSASGEPSTISAAPVSRLVSSVNGRSASISSSTRSWTPAAGCTKTSMCPPQASPTSNARSSATPNSRSFGCPAARTFWASSNTAPSMHPLDTDPAMRPDRLTSILEPRGRGLEPQVVTTVAIATSSPAARHSRYSLATSRILLSPCRPSFVQTGQQPA